MNNSAEITINGRAPANPFGSCFDAAAINFVANSDPRTVLCHGIGISNHPDSSGERIAHAWIEMQHEQKGRIAMDPIWLIWQSAEIYRKNLHTELVITYPLKEFVRLWKRKKYPGPFDPRIKALTKERKAE